MANDLRHRSLLLSLLLTTFSGLTAHAQQAGFSATPPQLSAEPGVLLEIASGNVIYTRGAARPINKNAIRRGEPLRVTVDGRTVEYAYDRMVEVGGDAVTWIGYNAANEPIYVTISPGAAYVDLNIAGRPLQIASEQAQARVLRGGAPTELREKAGYRKHRRAIALEKLSPKSIRVDARTGRIGRIRAEGLGQVLSEEFVPSSDYLDALDLGHEPDLRLRGDGSGEISKNWSYHTYDQYLNGFVAGQVRIIYHRETGEVTSVISPIYSAEDLPKPAPDDVAAQSAQVLVEREFVQQYGYQGDLSVSTPELMYGYGPDEEGTISLVWRVYLNQRDSMYVAFVDAKSGKATVRSMAKPIHTCTANSTDAMTCTDPQTTLVIDSQGNCVNHCGTPMETAHREAIRLYEEAIARYLQIGYQGGVNNFDPDVEIVTDTNGLSSGALAQVSVDSTTYETRITVTDMNWAMSSEVMYHEAAHVYSFWRNPMFRPDSPYYNAGTFTLDESIAYILDAISNGSTAGLNFPNAHVADYVDTYDDAVGNAQILAQAFHKWITTPNSTTIEMAERIFLRAIKLMQPCTGSACLDFTDPVRDVLDFMDDNDEVTGPQETAIKNDFFAAMGSVGIGPQAQPPGGSPPPPPPVPSAPVLAHHHWGCDAGVSWWTVLWSPVANANIYPVYADFGFFLGTDTIPPTYIYTSNVSANVYMHACGVGGCSGPSNSVYVNDICH